MKQIKENGSISNKCALLDEFAFKVNEQRSEKLDDAFKSAINYISLDRKYSLLNRIEYHSTINNEDINNKLELDMDKIYRKERLKQFIQFLIGCAQFQGLQQAIYENEDLGWDLVEPMTWTQQNFFILLGGVWAVKNRKGWGHESRFLNMISSKYKVQQANMRKKVIQTQYVDLNN